VLLADARGVAHGLTHSQLFVSPASLPQSQLRLITL
jgi:hypothetical protein